LNGHNNDKLKGCPTSGSAFLVMNNRPKQKWVPIGAPFAALPGIKATTAQK
jgi:hypothetical protein